MVRYNQDMYRNNTNDIDCTTLEYVLSIHVLLTNLVSKELIGFFIQWIESQSPLHVHLLGLGLNVGVGSLNGALDEFVAPYRGCVLRELHESEGVQRGGTFQLYR